MIISIIMVVGLSPKKSKMVGLCPTGGLKAESNFENYFVLCFIKGKVFALKKL